MKFLCPEEVDKFFSAAREAPWPYYYLFYTMLFTGLRRSEALALTWSNLDLDLCVLSVTQTLHRLGGGKRVIQPPKTLKPKLSVTIITGYPNSDMVARALAQGPFRVMNKPFGESDIMVAVNTFLRLTTARTEH